MFWVFLNQKLPVVSDRNTAEIPWSTKGAICAYVIEKRVRPQLRAWLDSGAHLPQEFLFLFAFQHWFSLLLPLPYVSPSPWWRDGHLQRGFLILEDFLAQFSLIKIPSLVFNNSSRITHDDQKDAAATSLRPEMREPFFKWRKVASVSRKPQPLRV